MRIKNSFQSKLSNNAKLIKFPQQFTKPTETITRLALSSSSFTSLATNRYLICQVHKKNPAFFASTNHPNRIVRSLCLVRAFGQHPLFGDFKVWWYQGSIDPSQPRVPWNFHRASVECDVASSFSIDVPSVATLTPEEVLWRSAVAAWAKDLTCLPPRSSAVPGGKPPRIRRSRRAGTEAPPWGCARSSSEALPVHCPDHLRLLPRFLLRPQSPALHPLSPSSLLLGSPSCVCCTKGRRKIEIFRSCLRFLALVLDGISLCLVGGWFRAREFGNVESSFWCWCWTLDDAGRCWFWRFSRIRGVEMLLIGIRRADSGLWRGWIEFNSDERHFLEPSDLVIGQIISV